uniref:ANK_REP_REGION domain-containing protein n=1 Tax=Macrostomum lignano TaxID=282301 RepID=A0A1I8JRL7_9PLAT
RDEPDSLHCGAAASSPGIELNLQGYQGYTAAHFACLNDSAEALEVLTQRGLKLCIPNRLGSYPVHVSVVHASKRASTSWSEPILGAEIDTPPRPYKVSEHDQAPMLNCADCQEDTVLLLSARQAAVDCIRALLAHGADVSAKFAGQLNQKDTFGCTPLHYAIRKGYMAVTNVLLKLGAECYVLNLDFSSPLHFAARYGRFNTCRSLIDSCPMLLNIVDRQGKSPLHLAAEGGHAKVVGLLLQRGSVLLKDTNGNTALHLVAKQGHIDVAKLILAVNHGIIDAKNRLE